MKYIGLGYIAEKKWASWSESEREAFMDGCFDYDDIMRANGQFPSGEALQGPRKGVTLRWQKGQVAVTDGPYAETKEQLGGIWILEARDLNHAIQIMSKHPAVKGGPVEIRPAADLNGQIQESKKRREAAKKS